MLTREEVERIENTLQRNLSDFEIHGGMVRYWASIIDAKTLLREYRAVVDERDALAAEGRLLREALGTIREECVADGYPNVSYVPLIDEALSDAPLIAAEVERVKRLEAVAEAAEAQDPPASANLARALAAYRTGVASIVWTSPDEGNNWTIRVRYRESDG